MMHDRWSVRHRPGSYLIAVVITTAMAASPRSGMAQTAVGDPTSPRGASCIDTISSAAAQRIAYLRATIQDSADEHLSQSADLFAQSVAQRLRVMLGAKGDTLPPAEPTLTWRNVRPGVSVVITAAREGGIAVQPLAANVDPVAGGLLTRIARAVEASGDWFFWPPEAKRDSASFELSIVLAPPHETQLTGDFGYAFPIFSMAYPVETGAVLTTTTVPPHPDKKFGVSGDGTVVLEFVVDSAGRVDTTTIRDPLENDPERPTGQAGEIYDEFVKSLRAWLPTAKYEPATIGGCAVSQLVQQPFTFSVE